MEDKEIYILFSRVAEGPDRHDESARKVFSSLIRTTLKYRDQMLKSQGTVITVEDVRTALDWLIPCLKTGRLPEKGDKKSMDLLKLWLDEIRRIGNTFY
jgi:hypothetical protein